MRLQRKAAQSLVQSCKDLPNIFVFDSSLKMHSTVLDTKIQAPADFLYALIMYMRGLDHDIAAKWTEDLVTLQDLIHKQSVPGWQAANKDIYATQFSDLREKTWANHKFTDLSRNAGALDAQLHRLGGDERQGPSGC